ncbi:hypothetical protein [Litorimonas cladophorae]|nr:hypothetical protein [Litorimonas cladophorae]
MHFKTIAITTVASVLLGCSGGTNLSFQSDADVYRLQDLEYYGDLIEAYKVKTGTYPFLDEAQDLPVYSVIASPEQIDDVQALPFRHISKSPTQFFQEIEAKLGRAVDERYDPQFEPDRKPNFYIYKAGGEGYFFAVHISQPYGFAQAVGPGYNKVEISNVAGGDNYASSPKSLFAHPSFRAAVEAPVAKPGFFDQRRSQYSDSYPTLP